MDLELHLTTEEVKIVREALLDLPARQSMILIAKIDSQIIEQTKGDING